MPLRPPSWALLALLALPSDASSPAVGGVRLGSGTSARRAPAAREGGVATAEPGPAAQREGRTGPPSEARPETGASAAPRAAAPRARGPQPAGESDPTAELAPPRRLEAHGRPIEALLGHAAPHLADWDGDGDLDLLVGQLGEGMLAVHLDRRAPGGPPTYGSASYLAAGGAPVRLATGGTVGFGPELVDLDADGVADVLTGEYWPGDVRWFRGRGDGTFDAARFLHDVSGRPLNAGLPWASADVPRRESLAATVCATDFDGDGDADVLIGNHEGSVVLVENVGTPRAPRFSLGRRKLEVAGSVLRAPGGDAAPVHADWDGDGRRDLVVGAADGSVRWYPNVGEERAPRFGAGLVLVAAADPAPLPAGVAPTRSGTHAKVAVADQDGDGLVDLLVGDRLVRLDAEPDLAPSDLARRDRLRDARDALQAEVDRVLERDAAGDVRELGARLAAVYEELAALEARATVHGYVWLHRRVDPRGER